MKNILKYVIVCAFIMLISACSNKVLTSSSSSLKSEKTLLDLMNEKIAGINVGMWPSANAPRAGLVGGRAGQYGVGFSRKMSYKVNDKELHLIIDGVDIERFYTPDLLVSADAATTYVQDRNQGSRRDRLQFIENYLRTIKADDVTGLKLLTDAEYLEKYKRSGPYRVDESLSAATTGFAYVEITTRSGDAAK